MAQQSLSGSLARRMAIAKCTISACMAHIPFVSWSEVRMASMLQAAGPSLTIYVSVVLHWRPSSWKVWHGFCDGAGMLPA